MPIVVTCHICQSTTAVHDRYAGHSMPCKSCGTNVLVPCNTAPVVAGTPGRHPEVEPWYYPACWWSVHVLGALALLCEVMSLNSLLVNAANSHHRHYGDDFLPSASDLVASMLVIIGAMLFTIATCTLALVILDIARRYRAMAIRR